LPPEHNTPYVLENIRRAPPDRVPSPGSTAVAGWPVTPGSGVSFGGSLFHLGDQLGPSFPGAVAVYIGDAERSRRFKTLKMPDVASHEFEVGERRGWTNFLRFQAIADSLPGQLSKDGHRELV